MNDYAISAIYSLAWMGKTLDSWTIGCKSVIVSTTVKSRFKVPKCVLSPALALSIRRIDLQNLFCGALEGDHRLCLL